MHCKTIYSLSSIFFLTIKIYYIKQKYVVYLENTSDDKGVTYVIWLIRIGSFAVHAWSFAWSAIQMYEYNLYISISFPALPFLFLFNYKKKDMSYTSPKDNTLGISALSCSPKSNNNVSTFSLYAESSSTRRASISESPNLQRRMIDSALSQVNELSKNFVPPRM